MTLPPNIGVGKYALAIQLEDYVRWQREPLSSVPLQFIANVSSRCRPRSSEKVSNAVSVSDNPELAFSRIANFNHVDSAQVISSTVPCDAHPVFVAPTPAQGQCVYFPAGRPGSFPVVARSSAAAVQ